MSPDPLEVAGFVGGWCVLSAVLIGAWVATVEIGNWRARRAERRVDRQLGPRLVDDGAWAPEWEADWPHL